jgi:hypothetical protein
VEDIWERRDRFGTGLSLMIYVRSAIKRRRCIGIREEEINPYLIKNQNVENRIIIHHSLSSIILHLCTLNSCGYGLGAFLNIRKTDLIN